MYTNACTTPLALEFTKTDLSDIDFSAMAFSTCTTCFSSVFTANILLSASLVLLVAVRLSTNPVCHYYL